jgi:soluble lytic murein transglycosylase
LNDPVAARRHFATLAALSQAAITQGRAHYWLGRAIAASGGDPKPEYERAAAWPTTFYGQLAALALDDDAARLAARITALRDPPYTRDQVLAFTDREVVRAAAMLVAWNDPHRARAFLLRMDELAPDAADRALTARFALRVGLPDTAVFIARRMGRDGLILPQAGWPIAAEPPDASIDSAVALGLIRQESSFDIGAVSPSGARGLMQLMPFTARTVAKQIGTDTSLISLTSDPAHNMRLGTTYLRQMLDRFDNSLPLAIAAYNAGPHRVDEWLGENGDPRVGPIDMLDWIELIPISETRNYVQRVLENVVVYRAKRGDATPTLLTTWTQ